MCAYVACVYSVTCSVWPSPQHLTSMRRTRRTSKPRPAWQGAAGCLSLSWSRGPPTRSAGAPASALASDARGPGFRGWPRSRVCGGLWQLPAQTHVHTLTRRRGMPTATRFSAHTVSRGTRVSPRLPPSHAHLAMTLSGSSGHSGGDCPHRDVSGNPCGSGDCPRGDTEGILQHGPSVEHPVCPSHWTLPASHTCWGAGQPPPSPGPRGRHTCEGTESCEPPGTRTDKSFIARPMAAGIWGRRREPCAPASGPSTTCHPASQENSGNNGDGPWRSVPPAPRSAGCTSTFRRAGPADAPPPPGPPPSLPPKCIFQAHLT